MDPVDSNSSTDPIIFDDERNLNIYLRYFILGLYMMWLFQIAAPGRVLKLSIQMETHEGDLLYANYSEYSVRSPGTKYELNNVRD